MCTKPIKLTDRDERVPCGFCVECRSRYARGWAIRCMHEAMLHDQNCFGTLTYDDEHLPEYGSLKKEHFTKFMKELRRELDERVPPVKVKFYAVGEYGDENRRPHYHFLLFGYGLGARISIPSKSSFPLYRSVELEKFWTKGISSISDVTFASCSYVARYVMKKVDQVGRKKKWHCDPLTGDMHEIEAEFSNMSRGGRTGHGIGYDWYQRFGEEVVRLESVRMDGNSLMPPRYYDNLLRQRDAAAFDVMKLRRARKQGVKRYKSRMDGSRYDDDVQEMMAREVIARERLHQLSRRL